jgi:lysophospholipase L1-like esterase
MSLRPEQPEPFMRGAPYPATTEVPYPRANPTDTARLAADIWHAATLPAGVRIEVIGDAQAIDVAYRTTTGNLGYRGDGAGIVFSVWRGGRKICEEEAALGDGLIRLTLGSATPETPATVYLPEGMRPVVLSLTAVKGEISPAPELPRWIAYGDSATQGWIASGPAQGWAAIAARKGGLDLVNLGYAGAGRGEIVSAEHIAAMSADIITVAYGSSCWTRTPHSTGMVEAGLRGFLDVVRMDHPTTPIVVVSPILRPDAEDTANKLGATLADIRHAIESVTRERIVAGDATLSLVAGSAVINAEHLADGIHPGDEGHKRIAAAVGKALTTALRYSEETAVPEILTESLPNFGMTVITGGRSESEETDESPVTEDDDAAADVSAEEEVEAASVDEDSELPAKASLS